MRYITLVLLAAPLLIGAECESDGCSLTQNSEGWSMPWRSMGHPGSSSMQFVNEKKL
jgi:hypothetical protein